jgi:hypothetical protein
MSFSPKILLREYEGSFRWHASMKFDDARTACCRYFSEICYESVFPLEYIEGCPFQKCVVISGEDVTPRQCHQSMMYLARPKVGISNRLKQQVIQF